MRDLATRGVIFHHFTTAKNSTDISYLNKLQCSVCWCRHIKATRPGKRVLLLVAVSHREHGEYFLASLQMRLADLQ